MLRIEGKISRWKRLNVFAIHVGKYRDLIYDNLVSNAGTDRTLIFVELKRVADFLACLLSENNFPTTSISGFVSSI